MIAKIQRWYSSHIRHQVFTIITVLMLVVSVALGVISWAATEIAADSFINQRVSIKQQNWIQASLKRGEHTPLNLDYLKIYRAVDSEKPSYLQQIDKDGLFEFPAYDAHVVTFPSPFDDKRLHLVYWPNRDPEMADYGDGVIAYVCYMMLLVFALGLLSAHLISRHFSAPILTLTQQVEQFSNQNGPLVNTNRSDEVGELHRAFFAAFSRIQAFLEREKQFTRFSSHELRTPIHVIGGSVQLLELSDNDERRLNILKRISDANKDMEQLINTFLFIGREHQNTQPQVSLAETLQNCIAQHEYLLSGRSINVECRIHSDEKSEVYFSKVVLANVVRNAFSYAQSRVTIFLSGQRLVIVNDIAPDTESGFGHGKEIISAICHSANWRFYAAIGDSKATTVVYF